MKTNSKDIPQTLLPLGNGRYHFNYNVVSVPDGYDCDTVEVGSSNYDDIVNAIIREKYSSPNEFAIHRQKDSKPTEWAEYNNFCESVKSLVKNIL